MTPDQPTLLLKGEVAKLLRIEPRTLTRLIEEGVFPRPQQVTKGLQAWSQDDVRYYLLWMQLRHRLRPGPPRGKKSRLPGDAV